MPNLVVLTGLRSGTIHPLAEGVIVGRGANVDLRLPDLLVSAQHAEIRPGPDGFTVHDLSSTNGTYRNGQRLQGSEPLELEDVLVLGSTELVFTEQTEASSEKSRVLEALVAPPTQDDPNYAVRLVTDTDEVNVGALRRGLALPLVDAVLRSFSLAEDLDALVARIADQLARASGGRGVVIALERDHRPRVIFRGRVSGDTVYPSDDLEFAVREDLLERALANRGVLLARAGPDNANTAVFGAAPEPQMALCVSLPTAAGIVGAAYVHDVRSDLSDQDLRLLLLIANLAGVHARNRLLLDALREGNRSLRRRSEQLEDARAELSRLNEELRGTVDARTQELGRADRRMQLLSRIVENTPEAIVSTTLDGEVSSWNPGAEQLYGYNQEEVLGELLPTVPDTRGAEFERILQAVATGRSFTQRTERVARGERVIPVLATYAPVSEGEGNIVGLVEIARDLTEQLRTEERMRWNERLASFGELAAGLAHELGNPLSNLRSGVEFLLARERSPKARKESLSVLRDEIDRLHRLIKQTLDLARWPAPTATEVSAKGLLLYAVKTLAPRAEELGVEVVGPAAATPDVRLRADADQLKQCLLNLASNALAAMPSGGRLELGVIDDGDVGGFTVADSGIGISTADQERVFDLFFSKRQDGSGIGLAMVKRIVDVHAGTLSLDSEPGEGTVVQVRLPKFEGDAQ